MAQPPEIDGDEWFYRRIHPNGWAANEGRPQKSQFEIRVKRGEVGLSLFRASACTQEDVLDTFEGFGLARIQAALFRELNLALVPVAQPELDEPLASAHYEARVDATRGGQIPQASQLRLAVTAEMVVLPTTAAAHD